MNTTTAHLAAMGVPESEWDRIIEENDRVHCVPVELPDGKTLVVCVQDDRPDENALAVMYAFAEMQQYGDPPSAYRSARDGGVFGGGHPRPHGWQT
jgi:hypothetical protein